MKTMKGLKIHAEWAPKPGYELSYTEKKRRLAYKSNMVWKNPIWKIESDIPVPSPKSNQILIKVIACGVCGSDVHMLMKDSENYVFFAGEAAFPVIIGHEFAGEVVEVGKAVKKFKIGDLVTVEECQWCGECNPCRYGFYNQCSNLDQLGFDNPNDGAMAEYVVADEKFCWSINMLEKRYKEKDLVLEAGSLVEPTCVAYEGIFTIAGGIQPGGNVVIFGTGPIGLASIQLLKTSGAGTIIAFEPNQIRRELAKKMGADFVYDPLDESISSWTIVQNLTNGSGVTMAVECSGEYDKVIPKMEKMITFAGKIVLLGMGPNFPTIDPMVYHRNGASLYGSLGHSGHGDFPNVINLMANGRINMLPIITSRYPLDDAITAIESANLGKDAKIIINP